MKTLENPTSNIENNRESESTLVSPEELQAQTEHTEAKLQKLSAQETERAAAEDAPEIEAIKHQLEQPVGAENESQVLDINPRLYRFQDENNYYGIVGDSLHLDTGNFGGGGADARDIRVRDNLLQGEYSAQVHFLPKTQDTEKLQGNISSETVRSTSKRGRLEAGVKMIGDLLTYIDTYKENPAVKIGENGSSQIQLPRKLWGRTNEQMAALGTKLEGAVTVIEDTTELEEKKADKNGKLKKVFPGQNLMLGKRKKEQEKPFVVIDVEGFSDDDITMLQERYTKQSKLLQKLIDKESKS